MKLLSIFLCVILVLLLAGCLTNVEQPVPEISVSTLETTKFTATPTLTPPSIVPTLTQIPTQLPSTQTPFPTLTSDEARIKLFNLLLNNGGCNLPCLLGYSPEISTREDIQSFFSQFRVKDTPELSISRPVAIDRSVIRFYIHFDDSYLNLGITTYEDKGQVKAFGMGSFSQPEWDPHYVEIMNYYMLPQILANYGEPSQVLILTFRDDRQRPDVTAWPFLLTIIYPDQGIYVKYEMSRQTSGDKFIGCPSKSFVDVAVWTPGDNETYEKMMEATILGNYLSDYKSISDAAALDKEQFYQVFSNPANKDCIKTPIETWPNP